MRSLTHISSVREVSDLYLFISVLHRPMYIYSLSMPKLRTVAPVGETKFDVRSVAYVGGYLKVRGIIGKGTSKARRDAA